MKLLKILKIIAINIVVLIGLLIALNLSAIIIFHGYKKINPISNASGKTSSDIRAGLPNYKNIDWAKKHFEEFGELPAEYRSYIGWRRLPYEGETISIDEQGIRNTPQSELATEKSPIVVFLGGSAMWGTGSNDENTIPALFAKNAQGDYRTVNLGETAYNAFQGYLFLKLQIINGLSPDIVVSYDGVNDGYSLKSGLRPFGDIKEEEIRTIMKGKNREKEEKIEEALSFSHFFLNPLKSFISEFKSPSTLKDGNSNAKKITYDLSQERIDQTAIALLESWLSTKDLAEKHGARFIAVLQPTASIGKPYLEYLELDEDPFELFYPAVLKLLQTPKYQELSNYVIVLTGAFDIEEPIYIDNCHVSPNGNKIIATIIYDHINNSIDNKKRN
ncbi:MAG: hypothetical protein WC901_06965 [Candidatus Margulisiibacteriota bacterium]